MSLSDNMVVSDLRAIEDFAKMDQKYRSNPEEEGLKLDVCLFNKSKAGLWYVYALVESSDCDIDDSRVAGLLCLADGDFNPMMATTDYLLGLPWTDVEADPRSPYTGQVRINCGTIGFMCVESIRRCVQFHGISSDDNCGFSNFIRCWANNMCQGTSISSKVWLSNVPNGPIGAISSVGICDNGMYKCQIIKDDVSGEVYAFRVMFPETN